MDKPYCGYRITNRTACTCRRNLGNLIQKRGQSMVFARSRRTRSMMRKSTVQTPSVGGFKHLPAMLLNHFHVLLQGVSRFLRSVFSQPPFLQIWLKNSRQFEFLFRMSKKHPGLLSSVSSLKPFSRAHRFLFLFTFCHNHAQQAASFAFVRTGPPSRFALEFSFRCRISCHSVYHFRRTVPFILSQHKPPGLYLPPKPWKCERLSAVHGSPLRITGTKKAGR